MSTSFDLHNPYTLAATLCSLALFLVAYQIWLYPLFFSPLRKIPGPSYGHILFGQFGNMLKAEAGILQRVWNKQYGGEKGLVRAIGPFGIERVWFCTPEALQKILVADWTQYPRPRILRNVLGLVTGFGLLTVTGNEHKQMRRVMNPAFSIAALTNQTVMYWEHIETLIDILKNKLSNNGEKPDQGKVLTIYEWMSKVTLDIICDTGFGYQTHALTSTDNELASSYEHLVGLQSGGNLTRLLAVVQFPGTTWLLQTKWLFNRRHWLRKSTLTAPIAEMMECMDSIKRISAELLRDKLKDSETVGPQDSGKDIMSLLVRARDREISANPEGAPPVYRMTDQSMMDQVLTFLGAGHETTASGLAWTLWLLAKDPEGQKKLREECVKVLGENVRPDYRTLKDMQWMNCVVMESLRLMPPVPMTFRQAAKNDSIDGVYIPKGTLLYMPIRVINTWAEIWGPDAEEWRPARWLDLPKSYHTQFSLQSFISGPHACIGRTMAISEMKAVLIRIIANFSFAPAYEGQVPKPTAAITMKPADELPLLVKPVLNAAAV